MKAGVTLFTSIGLIGSSLVFQACSSSGSSAVATSTSYSTTLPSEIAVASPTAQRTSGSSLGVHSVKKTVQTERLKFGQLSQVSSLSADASAEDKVEAIADLLSSTAIADCNISLTLSNAGNANCYGPSVSYSNHSFNASSGSWPGGDLGIWENSVNGEACSAAQLNSRILGVASLVDVGMFTMAGMACVAQLRGYALPAVAASLDLTADMASRVTINATALTITAASIARDADVGGNAVYIHSFTGTAGTKTYTIRLKHVALDATNSTYRGKVSVQVGDSNPSAKTGNCSPSTATGGQDAVSVAYEKGSSTSAKMLLKSANFCGYDADPYISGSDFSVDLTKTYATSSQEKGWGNNGNYFLASFDPSSYAGQYSYAWQAGAGDSHTRTFNVVLSGASSSALSGSAFFGYGPQAQSGPGAISGMICAWTGPDASHTPINKVQRQDLAMASGKFTASSSLTTYDPVDTACETSTAMIMTWTTSSGASPRDASATTNNLAPLADVASVFGSLPTVPTEVD